MHTPRTAFFDTIMFGFTSLSKLQRTCTVDTVVNSPDRLQNVKSKIVGHTVLLA